MSSTSAATPKVKLVYFDLQGRGELIRILLKVGDIQFEDFRFGFEDWPKHKPNTIFGQVSKPFDSYARGHTRDGIALEFRGDCPFIIAIARFKTRT